MFGGHAQVRSHFDSRDAFAHVSWFVTICLAREVKTLRRRNTYDVCRVFGALAAIAAAIPPSLRFFSMSTAV